MITYYLATNEVDIFHYGELLESMEVATGQPNLFFYDTEEELITVLESYGQQYQKNYPLETPTDDLLLPPPYVISPDIPSAPLPLPFE
jgi:hypothetical protein